MLKLSLAFFLLSIVAAAQNPLIKQWDYRYGGTSDEYIYDFRETSDGGFLLAGQSRSGINGDKTQPNWDNSNLTPDFWIIKTDASGIKLWDKRYGGNNQEILKSAILTSDKGYLLGGFSISGVSGDKTQPKWGTTTIADWWIIKIDSVGNKQWDKRFGGTQTDQLHAMVPSNDGGYLLAGTSLSGIDGDKTQSSQGSNDYWVVRIDASGNKIWDKRFGGNDIEELKTVTKTPGGNYILGGYSRSQVSGDKSQNNWDPNGAANNSNDYWLVKINDAGNKLWDKRYGGTGDDRMWAIAQYTDGDLVLAGLSSSGISGDKSVPCEGSDYWIIKVDSNGNKLWDNYYYASGANITFNNVIITADGGLALSGTTYDDAGGLKTENNLGDEQGWIVKTDSLGNFEWDKTILTDGYDACTYVLQTLDGCYVIANYTWAGIGGYKTQDNYNDYVMDIWFVKFCEAVILPVSLSSFTVSLTKGYQENKVLLLWSTASESNSCCFIIEQSSDGIQFTEIDTVQGAVYSTAPRDYTFTHEHPQPGVNYYRLRQQDLNGSFYYSITRSINNPASLIEPEIYFSGGEIISMNHTEEIFSAELYSLPGQHVNQFIIPAGRSSWKPKANLSGIFYLLIKDSAGNASRVKKILF